MTRILGVDGARGGWLGALTRTDDVMGVDVVWVTFATIAQALELDVDVIAAHDRCFRAQIRGLLAICARNSRSWSAVAGQPGPEVSQQ